MRNYFFIFIIIFFTGCSNLFFQPQKKMVLSPALFEIEYDIITKKVNDDILYGWHLKTKEKNKKGTIIYLHGNGGNISFQIFSAFWFPWYGYDVISFDYRGYGNSTGEPSIENIHADVKAIFDYTLKHKAKGEKVYIFAQSLGGSVATTSLANYDRQNEFSKIIIDSAFSSYDKVARDALQRSWITYLFSPLSNTVEFKKLDPINNIQNINIPVILVHGKTDSIVDYKHSELLYEKANKPKYLWLNEDSGHIGLFYEKTTREKLIKLIQSDTLDWNNNLK